MRHAAIILPALLAGVPAVMAQKIEFALADAMPDPTYSSAIGLPSQTVPYDAKAAVASVVAEIKEGELAASDGTDKFKPRGLERRTDGDCHALPLGEGPSVTPDTAEAFASWPAFAAAANGAPTPAGYINTFKNLNASNNAFGYMGYQAMATYDTNACAALCDARDGCHAINIYFERSPTKAIGPACQDQLSTTTIKCVFWGGPVTKENAKNYGFTDLGFTVVNAGSNGYVSTKMPSQPGYTGPNPLGDVAINAPLDCEGTHDSYMGVHIFTDTPFDPALCAAACTATSQFNLEHPPSDGSEPRTCNFFNTFILLMNGQVQGQYCSMYTRAWDNSYATNNGQWRGEDHFTIQYSFTYSNATFSGEKCPAKPSSTSTPPPAATSTTAASSYSSVPTTTSAPTRTTTTTTTTKASTTTSTCTCAASAKPCSKPRNAPLCNKSGYNVYGNSLARLQGSKQCPTRELCAWNCLQSNSCKSFAWSYGQQKCVLFGEAVRAAKFLWKYSDFAMHDMDCYEYDCGKGSCASYPKPTPNKPLPFLSKCTYDKECACGRCLNFSSKFGICI